MRLTAKAERLISELLEILWDNNQRIIKNGNGIENKPTAGYGDREKEMQVSAELLLKHVHMNASVGWLVRFKRGVQDEIRIAQVASSIVEIKQSEKLEALRSRVMVKAIQNAMDTTDQFTVLVKADTEREILELERWFDNNQFNRFNHQSLRLARA